MTWTLFSVNFQFRAFTIFSVGLSLFLLLDPKRSPMTLTCFRTAHCEFLTLGNSSGLGCNPLAGCGQVKPHVGLACLKKPMREVSAEKVGGGHGAVSFLHQR